MIRAYYSQVNYSCATSITVGPICPSCTATRRPKRRVLLLHHILDKKTILYGSIDCLAL